jgi:hypothetical protein
VKLLLVLFGLTAIACSVLSTLFIVAPCEPGFGWRFFAGTIANGSAFAWGWEAINKVLKEKR